MDRIDACATWAASLPWDIPKLLLTTITCLKLPSALVIDEGRTELSNGSITCLGIGPATKELIDEVTGKLRLL